LAKASFLDPIRPKKTNSKRTFLTPAVLIRLPIVKAKPIGLLIIVAQKNEHLDEIKPG
jgi:hypothetical protein